MIFIVILILIFNFYLNAFFFKFCNYSNFFFYLYLSNFINYKYNSNGFFFLKNFKHYFYFLNINDSIKLKKNFNYFFFSYFINKYFTNKIKKNFFLYFNNFNSLLLEDNKYYNWIFSNIKKLNYNSIFNNNLKYMFIILKTIIFFFYTKDTYFLCNWLKKLFEIIYYKNHKKLLVLIKYIFSFFYKYLKTYLNIKGFIFLLKGKISLSGNSKKKLFKYQFGSYSLNKKSFLFNFNKNYINTLSGVLGFYVFIFF